MSLQLLSNPLLNSSSSQSQSHLSNLLARSRSFNNPSFYLQCHRFKVMSLSQNGSSHSKMMRKIKGSVKEDVSLTEKPGSDDWGKVSAVLFDMDGVLCNSEETSRLAGVDVFAEMGVDVNVDDFVPFMGTGEANFLGGVAIVKGVADFNPEAAKKRFFEIYLEKYAKPNSGIGFPGALELITECKNSGLKVAVASSADRIKVDANLAAAGLPLSMFDAIVSADAFENLKPAPDIFIAASKILNVLPSECLVIEDALAGVQAAKAAQMRCIAVTTTLSEDTLTDAEPSLIRKEIGNISLKDILGGGSSYSNTKMQGSQSMNNPAETSGVVKESIEGGSFQDAYSTNEMVFSVGGLQGSRRQILRYGSLGIALSCLCFTVSNMKAMQYTSPKAIWNLVFGGKNTPFGQSEDRTRSSRIQQFINYILDVEGRGNTTQVPEFPSKLDWLNTAPLQLCREARSKFSVEVEPENAAVVDPLDGSLGPDGTAALHFKRSSPSATVGRVNCKVYCCKEDEVRLYQSLVCIEPPYHHHQLLTINDNPNPPITQKSLLNLLTTKCTTSLQYLKQTHALILKTNHFQDHYISGTLIKSYSFPYFNTLDSSLQVFHQVPNPNVFVWNSIMKACLDNNKFELGLLIYLNMVGSDTKANKFTYPMLFKACMFVTCVEKGVGIHCHVVKNGFMDDMYVKSAAIQMYSSFGRLIEARMILDYGESDVVCFNAMIDGYLKCGDVESARVLFESWKKKNVGSWNAMVTGLAKCGRVEEAREVFDEMSQRDEISWSAMIDGYNKNGCFKEALEVFREMQKEKVELTKFVLSSVALACANVGSLDQGKWIHGYVRRNSIELDVVLGTALLDMYAKLGRLDLAWDVFETMKRKEISSWNAMIGALAMHGRAKDAIELFVEMEKQRVKPDEITFVGLLNACAHGGLVDAGFGYFNKMQEVYKIEPTVHHYGCMVDLFGRVGQLAEAEELISTMPMTPSPAVWGALLGACKVHGNIDIGERIGKILINLDPQKGGRYALLSNIYAKAGRWEDVEKLRALMKDKGVKTTTGRSTIDLDGISHEFKIGESDHPRIREIYEMVEEMITKLKVEGYVPKTNEVLFDIDEDEKETNLWRHSEKLAIAFGLISTSPGTPIRVTKNLRMCEDCHSAIKLVSSLYERDIVVRDRLRFHHFRNGKCSCNDFW